MRRTAAIVVTWVSPRRGALDEAASATDEYYHRSYVNESPDSIPIVHVHGFGSQAATPNPPQRCWRFAIRVSSPICRGWG